MWHAFSPKHNHNGAFSLNHVTQIPTRVMPRHATHHMIDLRGIKLTIIHESFYLHVHVIYIYKVSAFRINTSICVEVAFIFIIKKKLILNSA